MDREPGNGIVGALGQALCQDQRKVESAEILLARPCGELAFVWHTKPVALVLRGERLRGSITKMDEPPLPSLVAPPELARREERGSLEWESYAWKPEGHQPKRGASAAGVATLARRLLAVERARAQRRKPTDLLAQVQGRRRGFGRQGDGEGAARSLSQAWGA